MLAIAKHANKKDIMVTWSYHGRDSPKCKYIAGNLVRLYPIRIQFKEKMKISDLNNEITKQSKDLLKKLYYPHILYSEDGLTAYFYFDGFDGSTNAFTKSGSRQHMRMFYR